MKRGTIIALIILLLAGGAAAGWYFWDKNKDSDGKNQSQPSSQVQGDYLVIKEWGLRIKLTENIKDAEYSISEDLNSVSLITDSVKNVAGCENSVAIMAIERAKQDESLGPTIANDNLVPPAIKVDDYYYLNTGPAHNCGQQNRNVDDQNRAGATKVGNVRNGFNDAFKTLEKLPRT